MSPRAHCLPLLLTLGLLTSVPATAQGALPTTDAGAGESVLQITLPAGSEPSANTPGRPVDSVVVAAEDDSLPWYHSGYPWKGIPPDAPDWPGVKRDTAYFFGYQVAVIGVLYLMPESVTNWDKSEIQDRELIDQWWDNVTHPEWDDDDWWINYILHPYWGGSYYVRGRERGLDRQQSFLFSALLSTLYEYSFEAFAEPVSIQDLIFTPVLGSLVGEYLFSPIRERIRAKPGDLDWSDKTLLLLTDPLGVLGSWTDRMLGVETHLTLQPIGLRGSRLAGLDADPEMPRTSALAAESARPWGLQLEVAW